jgi:hypothetical protein
LDASGLAKLRAGRDKSGPEGFVSGKAHVPFA